MALELSPISRNRSRSCDFVSGEMLDFDPSCGRGARSSIASMAGCGPSPRSSFGPGRGEPGAPESGWEAVAASMRWECAKLGEGPRHARCLGRLQVLVHRVYPDRAASPDLLVGQVRRISGSFRSLLAGAPILPGSLHCAGVMSGPSRTPFRHQAKTVRLPTGIRTSTTGSRVCPN
jgi:hypothetical protein